MTDVYVFRGGMPVVYQYFAIIDLNPSPEKIFQVADIDVEAVATGDFNTGARVSLTYHYKDIIQGDSMSWTFPGRVVNNVRHAKGPSKIWIFSDSVAKYLHRFDAVIYEETS